MHYEDNFDVSADIPLINVELFFRAMKSYSMIVCCRTYLITIHSLLKEKILSDQA
jgi:hypothetical protein